MCMVWAAASNRPTPSFKTQKAPGAIRGPLLFILHDQRVRGLGGAGSRGGVVRVATIRLSAIKANISISFSVWMG